ncbi:hypothetical protein IE077_000476 [Cardiosporidium cionae]|uniref:Deoxyhypusine synthase n=1 Tax=Cardiosporidium cionae TaxID=476202 RepID=A0ABQ7J917_9APIC|nr:hypothetical protein IE077_000476 [Cardiosporidium cionae]|eukprot:KAF8820490.1 hypothetical protein IE077_000476 [Cardiosporidium cionae]
MSLPTTFDLELQLPKEAVLLDSQPVGKDAVPVCGINFDEDITLDRFCESFLTSGFQATNLGLAIDEIRRMIKWRLSDEPVDKDDIGTSFEDPSVRAKTKYEQKDILLKNATHNNDTDWILTPSKLIDRLGKEINNENSLYYWCHVNNIPVYCPGITDGSLGDNLYFHAYRNPGLVLDVIQDIKMINDTAVKCKKSGMIILGGGLPKHHTCNANLMRNGADFAVYINTGQEFDGSDSGARPDEAISWGKIRPDAEPVKVCADASIVFPIVVAATFCKELKSSLSVKECGIQK